MITLHHLEYSQSFRVLWLLEELGADYQLKLYERDSVTRLAPSDYKAISPLGTAPAISEGDLALSETAAIFDYILDRHADSDLRVSSNSDSRAQYLFWFHAAQGSVMPMMLMDIVFQLLEKRSPFFIKPLVKGIVSKATEAIVSPRMTRILEQAESDLAATGWFAGKALSAADMMLSYPIESAYARGMLNEKHPNCIAWIERIQATDSYQSAKQKDGRPTAVFPI